MPITEKRRKYLRCYNRIWLKARRDAYLSANGPCVKCGSAEDLEIDHIDPSQKVTHRIWSWRKERRDVELAKCQIICKECHKRKTAIDIRPMLQKLKSPRRKLNRGDIVSMFRYRWCGYSQREIAGIFKIAKRTLEQILQGTSYREMTTDLV
jgi:hypothetical protein